MLALVVDRPGVSAVRQMPDPVPGPGEALVEVAAAGICGSDLELLDGRRPAAYVRYPVIPGHEWAGRVLASGPGVDGVAPGDPVVAEGLLSCGVCDRINLLQHGSITFDKPTSQTSVQELTDLVVAEYRAARTRRVRPDPSTNAQPGPRP